MSRITDYGFLFQTTFGTSKTNLVNNIQLSQMNSSSVQKQLKAAGIDTNSKKYKAALSEMMKNGNGAMFTNVQAIKNLLSLNFLYLSSALFFFFYRQPTSNILPFLHQVRFFCTK